MADDKVSPAPAQAEDTNSFSGSIAKRRVAPVLQRDLLTYNDDRYMQLFAAVHHAERPIALIQQSPSPFIFRLRPSAIVLVEDSATTALGPEGFDPASLRRCARRCVAAVLIVRRRRIPLLYQTAVKMAEGKGNYVLVIETRPEWLSAWESVLRAANPKMTMLGELTGERAHRVAGADA